MGGHSTSTSLMVGIWVVHTYAYLGADIKGVVLTARVYGLWCTRLPAISRISAALAPTTSLVASCFKYEGPGLKRLGSPWQGIYICLPDTPPPPQASAWRRQGLTTLTTTQQCCTASSLSSSPPSVSAIVASWCRSSYREP
jgi:hypothetical protein